MNVNRTPLMGGVSPKVQVQVIVFFKVSKKLQLSSVFWSCANHSITSKTSWSFAKTFPKDSDHEHEGEIATHFDNNRLKVQPFSNAAISQ